MPNVTRIGKHAFSYSEIKGIVIPEGVTTLGDSAIYKCEKMKYVDIPSTLVNYGKCSIDRFYDLESVYNRNPAVVDISGSFVFQDQRVSSISLYVPASSVDAYKDAWPWGNFKQILPFEEYGSGQCGENLYWTFVSEKSELILNGYGDMWDFEKDASPWHAFRKKITKISGSDLITKIGAYAFYGCSQITEAPLSDKVKVIGEKAFYGCSALESVLVPADLTKLEEGTFEGCDAITTVEWKATNCNRYYFGPQVSTFIFGAGIKVIPDSICKGMQMKYVEIPAGVTTIGEKAFAHCHNLLTISAPSSVQKIGRYAFYDCTNAYEYGYDGVQCVGTYYVMGTKKKKAESYTLMSSIRWIGEEAFKDCDVMQSFTLPEKTEHLGVQSFSGCLSMKGINIPSSLKSIDDEAFKNCSALDSIRVYATTPPSLGENVFSGVDCSQGRLYVPRESYNSYAAAEHWKDFWILNNDQIIGKCGDNLTWVLDTITFDFVIKGTGDMWDYKEATPGWDKWGKKIKAIVIENGVTSIGGYAFFNMTNLLSIQIPSTVTSIGDHVFLLCPSLSTVICLASTPPTMGVEVFKDIDCSKIPLCVPSASVSKYNAADQWKDFLIQSTKMEGSCGESVTWSLDIASGKLTIKGTGDMYNYPLDYPEWYTYHSFIRSIEIQNGVTAIGKSVFYNHENVQTVFIPQSVTSIRDGAFAQCKSLESITCLVATPPVLNSSVFTEVNQAAVTLYVPRHRKFAYQNADYWKNFHQIKMTDGSGQCGDNMVWAYYAATDELHISGSGKMWDFTSEDPTWYPFKEIIQNVEIGKDIAGITDGVFAGHIALTAINVAEGNWNYISEDGVLYNKAKSTIVTYPQAKADVSFTIPATVKNIKSSAFEGCTNLIQLNSLAVEPPTLGTDVFQGMDCGKIALFVPVGSKLKYKAVDAWSKFKIKEEGLCFDGIYYWLDGSGNAWVDKDTDDEDNYNYLPAAVTIPESITVNEEEHIVKGIMADAFNGCKAITSMTLPNTITVIEEYAFEDCSNLKSINLPESLKDISGEGVFYKCSALERVELPAGIQLGVMTFSGCTGLKRVINHSETPQDIEDHYVFEDIDVSKVELYVPYKCVEAYENAAEWKDFDIQETPVCVDGLYYLLDEDRQTAELTYQYRNDEENYADLEQEMLIVPSLITVENIQYNVTSIGKLAFNNCKKVQVLSLPESIEAIRKSAFANSGFMLITLPASLQILHQSAFTGATNLIVLRNFAKEPLAVGDFTDYTKHLLHVPYGTKAAYEAADVWKDFDIQEMQVCVDGLFYDLDNEQSTAQVVVDLTGRTYTDLGEEIVIPEQITVDDKTYTVTSIASVAFLDNAVVKKVTLPSQLQTIGESAFSGCTSIKEMYCYNENPPAIDETSFAGMSLSYCTLYIHRESITTYKGTDIWKNFRIVSIETPIMIAGQPIHDDQYGKKLTDIDGVSGDVIVTMNGIYLGEGAEINTYGMNVPAIELYAEGIVNTFQIGGKGPAIIQSDKKPAIVLGNSMTLNINTAFNSEETKDGLDLWIISQSEDGAVALANGSEVTLNINSLGWASTNSTEVYATNAAIGIPPSAHCDIHAGGYVDLMSVEDVCPIGVFETRTLTLHNTTMVLPFGGEVKEEGIFDADGNETFRLRLMPETTQSGKAYPLDIAGITVTDGNKADVLGDGKVSYEPTTNTMTLKNASIVEAFGQTLHATAGLRLKVVGDYNHLSNANGFTYLDFRPNVEVQGGDFIIQGDKTAALNISGPTGVQCDETEQYRMEVKRCEVTISANGDNSQWALQTDSLYINAATLKLYSHSGAVAWLSNNGSKSGGLVLEHAEKTSGIVNVDEEMIFEPENPLMFRIDVVADDIAHGTVEGEGWYEDGKIATLTATPAEGWQFVKWDDNVTENPRDVTVDDDMKFTAIFAIKTFHVTFVGFDGVTPLKEETVEYGQAATAPEAPEVEGYHFTGWDPADLSSVTEDLTVKATYAINTYTVKFYDKDDKEVWKQDVEHGKAVTPPDAPEVEGYHFTGWDPETDFSSITGNVTVKATYAINTYTVKFYDHSDNVISTQTVNWNEAAVEPELEAWAGHTFTSWSVEFDHVKSDLDIKPIYDVETYKVTFVGFDGETSLKVENVQYGQGATAPEAPAVEGYTFTGWDKAFDNITGDLTVKAVYERNYYKLTLVAEHGSIAITDESAEHSLNPDNIEHGTKVRLAATPDEGYQFKEWSTGEKTDVIFITVTANKTVTATFVLKSDEPTGIDQVPSDHVQCTKVLINGTLYIKHNDKTFDATGRLVR